MVEYESRHGAGVVPQCLCNRVARGNLILVETHAALTLRDAKPAAGKSVLDIDCELVGKFGEGLWRVRLGWRWKRVRQELVLRQAELCRRGGSAQRCAGRDHSRVELPAVPHGAVREIEESVGEVEKGPQVF